MSCCEKCWSDAYKRLIANPSKSLREHYEDLLIERDKHPCSPKEQAGIYWDEEKQIDKRKEKK